MGRTDHRDFMENLMTRRTEAALNARNLAFPKEHARDSDEQLIQYLLKCAKEIGHSPDMCEVIGGLYLARRFGGWQKAISRGGLPKPGPAPKWSRRIVLEERKRQRELFLKECEERRQAK